MLNYNGFWIGHINISKPIKNETEFYYNRCEHCLVIKLYFIQFYCFYDFDFFIPDFRIFGIKIKEDSWR